MEEKTGFIKGLLQSKMAMKILHSRATQFISAGVGAAVGKLASSGLLEKIQSNELVSGFMYDVGIPPTEAGLISVATVLAWATYNMLMKALYGKKFKEIQTAHGLKADGWAGPKTMEAAEKGGKK